MCVTERHSLCVQYSSDEEHVQDDDKNKQWA